MSGGGGGNVNAVKRKLSATACKFKQTKVAVVSQFHNPKSIFPLAFQQFSDH